MTNLQSIDNETLFEWATADISTFVAAAEALSTCTDAEPSTLFDFFVLKVRTARAINRLKAVEAKDYKPAAEKLIRIYSSATENINDDGLFSKFAENQTSYQELVIRTENAWNLLNRTRRIVQDGFLFNNRDWLQEDLEEIAEEFLVAFTELASFYEILPDRLLDIEAVTDPWRQFNRLEVAFRGWFGYFSGVEEIRARLAAREYGAEFWWFTETPDEKTLTADRTLTDEQQDMEAGKICPDEDLLYAYISGRKETGGFDLGLHLTQCRDCRSLAEAIRESERLRMRGEIPKQVAEIFSRVDKEKQKAKANGDSKPLPGEIPRVVVSSPWITWEPQVEVIYPHETCHVMIEPNVTEMEQLFQANGWSALQELPIPPQAHAATKRGTGVWAKIVRIAQDMIQKFSIVELDHIDIAQQEDEVIFAGALPYWLNLPEQVEWFCDLLKTDGTVLSPSKWRIKDRCFTATFPLGEKRAEDTQYGELRLLILVYG